MKQSSIDWLINHMETAYFPTFEEIEKAKQKAREMHIDEVNEAFLDGYNNGDKYKDYYIETFMTHPADNFPQIAGSAYSTLDTLRNSYDLGYKVGMGIEGDIVECGIAAGANFAMMIKGCLKAEGHTLRKFWGYDSFEGIQRAGRMDTEQAGIGSITHDVNVPDEELLVSTGITVHPMEQVVRNLNDWTGEANWKLVKGWVQNTVPFDYPEKISILRLDMDVYAPTIFVLRELYDNISTGGFIIIDDWALAGVRTAVMEFWVERGLKPEVMLIPNSTPVYWVKE